MLIEPLILGCHNRLPKMLGHRLQCDVLPILLSIEPREYLAVAIVDHSRLITTAGVGDVGVGELARHGGVDRAAGHSDRSDHEQHEHS